MGFVKKIFSFFSPSKPSTPTYTAPKPAAAPAAAPAASNAAADQETEDEKKKRALLALNAGGGAQGLGDTSSANVTKRNLLGL